MTNEERVYMDHCDGMSVEYIARKREMSISEVMRILQKYYATDKFRRRRA
jgi:Mor family transcriptional regulator